MLLITNIHSEHRYVVDAEAQRDKLSGKTQNLEVLSQECDMYSSRIATVRPHLDSPLKFSFLIYLNEVAREGVGRCPL